MMNFWDDLPRPFLALAPMEDVTDVVFRRVVARAGRPDVFFTEFTNTASFCSEQGEFSTRGRLTFEKEENPIVAQIWGNNPENFAEMARALAAKGFAGVDINMGCPDKKVVKSGGGSALIQTPELVTEIVAATHEGWNEGSNEATPTPAGKAGLAPNRQTVADEASRGGHGLAGGMSGLLGEKATPISIKTRLGYSKVEEWRSWLTCLLEQNLANLTVHLRTKKEMSKVPAHFELIPEIVRLRDQIAPRTKLTINGDIRDRAHAMELWREHPGIDGFMIGRGVFANPFCFTEHENPTRDELFDLLNYHLDLFDKYNVTTLGSEPGQSRQSITVTTRTNEETRDDGLDERTVAGGLASDPLPRKFEPLKRFFKIYVKDFPGAAELRIKLFECKDSDEVRKVLSSAR
ncbi:tRNA-dihydrouridine synthase family protein [Candidatus Saccharibacteria bacterium]|nr:tRNA-dihydrouridine synthase family protein [Candidatus Saccharibacteria bacterium]